MFTLARIPLLLAIFAAIAGGAAFLSARTKTEPPVNQAAYAEVPTDATPAAPVAATSSSAVARVPILVYHIVRPSHPNDSAAVRTLAHTPEVFDAEMKYLAGAGYHVISFGDLERHFRSGAVLPSNPIIISFDDGWRNQFEYAFPILEKYGYPATFFIFTRSIGARGFVTWDNVRTMRAAGMTVGSHSFSHPFLTRMTDPILLWNEIYGSKKELEKNLGVTVDEFAYPFGQYDADIVALVKKAGYASARGDYYYGATQSADRLYELSALNAPTTTALFARRFPAQ